MSNIVYLSVRVTINKLKDTTEKIPIYKYIKNTSVLCRNNKIIID